MSSSRAKRNSLEIAAQILEICTEGARRTEVLYRANLNSYLLSKYIKLLEVGTLVRYEIEARRYVITRKGQRFLVEYQELQDALHTYSAKRSALMTMLGNDDHGSIR